MTVSPMAIAAVRQVHLGRARRRTGGVRWAGEARGGGQQGQHHVALWLYVIDISVRHPPASECTRSGAVGKCGMCVSRSRACRHACRDRGVTATNLLLMAAIDQMA